MKKTIRTKAKRIPKRIRVLGQKILNKKTYPSNFDSCLEFDISNTLLGTWLHHPTKINYTSSHEYQPDFKKVIGDKVFYIEAKGRFRTRNEAAKYLAIREALAEGEELFFIFSDAAKPLVGATKRKDGTKQTHGEWATKNNFRFFCYKTGLPENIEEVLSERNSNVKLSD